MKNRSIVIALALFIGLAPALHAQAAFTPEENRLLALALEKNFAGNGYTVVAPATNPAWIMQETGKENEPLKKRLRETPALKGIETDALLARLAERNRESVRLTLESNAGNGYVIDFDGAFAAYFKEGGGGWQKWRKENPQAHGLTQVSVPVYDAKTGLVLVYIGTQFAPLAGGGYLVFYRLEKDKLVEVARIMLWIS
jgi:hypothetical protein